MLLAFIQYQDYKIGIFFFRMFGSFSQVMVSGTDGEITDILNNCLTPMVVEKYVSYQFLADVTVAKMCKIRTVYSFLTASVSWKRKVEEEVKKLGLEKEDALDREKWRRAVWKCSQMG